MSPLGTSSDQRLGQLQDKLSSVEDRIARIHAFITQQSTPQVAAIGFCVCAIQSNGLPAKSTSTITRSKLVGQDRGVNPLRPQPQTDDEYIADLLGMDSVLMQRQRQEIARLGVALCRLRRTPQDYYSWTLEQRRAYLQAPTISNLCKSMLMVNKKAPVIELGKAPAERFYASHYLVVYQYEVKFVNEKLIEHLRHAVPPPAPAKKRFNFRVAAEADNDELSGFVHNAVSPIGFRRLLEVPFVLDQRIVDTVQFMWLGGGEPDVKLAVSVSEFIRIFNPIIASVSTDETAPGAGVD